MSAVIIQPQIIGHTPHAHTEHDQTVNCGCWTRDSRLMKLHRFCCEACGAMYEREEVVQLARWRCYDCGTVYARTPAGVRPVLVGELRA